MGIFDNYCNNNNLNTSFNPNNFMQQCPSQNNNIVSNNPNKPYEVLDTQRNLIGYYWYYGNSVDLTWDIIGEVTSEEASQYVALKDMIAYLTLTATIYDWRHEIIEKVKLNPIIKDDNVSVTLSINNNLSNKMVKGIYRIELVASNVQGYNETLFSADTCKFEVK